MTLVLRSAIRKRRQHLPRSYNQKIPASRPSSYLSMTCYQLQDSILLLLAHRRPRAVHSIRNSSRGRTPAFRGWCQCCAMLFSGQNVLDNPLFRLKKCYRHVTQQTKSQTHPRVGTAKSTQFCQHRCFLHQQGRISNEDMSFYHVNETHLNNMFWLKLSTWLTCIMTALGTTTFQRVYSYISR